MDLWTIAVVIVFLILVVATVLILLATILNIARRIFLMVLSTIFPEKFRYTEPPRDVESPDPIYHGMDPQVYRTMDPRVRKSLGNSIKAYENQTKYIEHPSELDIVKKAEKIECPYCGTPANATSKKCPSCGAPLTRDGV